MRVKVFQYMALMALAVAALHSQPIAAPGTQPPITGPVYWSATAPDCSSLAGELPVAIAECIPGRSAIPATSVARSCGLTAGRRLEHRYPLGCARISRHRCRLFVLRHDRKQPETRQHFWFIGRVQR